MSLSNSDACHVFKVLETHGCIQCSLNQCSLNYVKLIPCMPSGLAVSNQTVSMLVQTGYAMLLPAHSIGARVTYQEHGLVVTEEDLLALPVEMPSTNDAHTSTLAST